MAITTPEKLAERADDFKALYRAWVRAVEFQKANEQEADEIMAKGVGGWLEDPAVFAETRAGIVYYDEAMNQAFIGTPEAPGTITGTIENALELGREIGQFEHDVAPGGADRVRGRQPVARCRRPALGRAPSGSAPRARRPAPNPARSERGRVRSVTDGRRR